MVVKKSARAAAIPRQRPAARTPKVKGKPSIFQRALPLLFAGLKYVLTKWRWQLIPLAGLFLVFWAGYGDGFAAALTGLISGLFYYSGKKKFKVRGRMFLSEIERNIAALWLCLASVWQLLALVLPWPWWLALAALAVMLAWPSFQWCISRMPPKPKKLSEVSTERLALWADKVAKRGPDALKGSKVLRSSAREPSEGVFVFAVELRDDVHNADAITEECRKGVEALLKLPAGTTELAANRDSSSRMEVTLAPSRNLEMGTVAWPGPEIGADGFLPLAVNESGEVIGVYKWNPDGVCHGRGCGTSGVGKSGTLRVLIPPGIDKGVEIAWLIDGKRGTSIPELQNAIDWYSVDSKEWGLLIDTLYDVMIDRQIRRGKAGKSGWVTGEEEDPNICLYIEESAEVKRVLRERFGKTKEAKIIAILQQGRALGISVYMTSQSPMAQNLLGEVDGRELMSMGLEILQKPGGKTGNSVSQDSSVAKVNLLGLPAGKGKEGFAAVLQGGEVVSARCRIRYASKEDAREWAASVTPRSLTGRDLEVAGAAYARRGADVIIGEVIEPEEEEVDESKGEELSDVQQWIVGVLGMYAEGLTMAELTEKGQGAHGRSRENIKVNLRKMKEQELITQVDGKKYVLL